MSTCPVCGKVIDDSNPYEGFPAFLGNWKDQLNLFNDTGVHVACVDAHPLGPKARFLADKGFECRPSSQSRCLVDGEVIEKMGDIIVTGVITSDEREPLYQFNFLTLNRKNVMRWKDRELFIETARRFLDEGKWDCGKYQNGLELLIKSMQV